MLWKTIVTMNLFKGLLTITGRLNATRSIMMPKENRMEFLNIVNAISAQVTPDNIEKMIALIEKLIDLGLKMEKHIEGLEK